MLKVCVLWALVIPATAQVYKWVDEKGATHYGERPPQGAKAREVEQRMANPGPAPEKASQPNWKGKDLEFRGRRIETEQAEAKQKQQQDAQRRACNQARDELAMFRSAGGVFRLDEKGERVYHSDAERNAAIARRERLVSELCR